MSQPDFVAQLKGKLTDQRYKAATIFVNQFSGLQYIPYDDKFVKRGNPQGKIGVWAICNQQLCLHWTLTCQQWTLCRQHLHCTLQSTATMTPYCSINAHFQNGISERAIHDISEVGRKQLLHCSQIGLMANAMRYAARQHHTSVEWRDIRIRKIIQYKCRSTYAGSPYVYIPRVCITKCNLFRQHDTKVVTPCTIGAKFRPKPISYTEHVTGS